MVVGVVVRCGGSVLWSGGVVWFGWSGLGVHMAEGLSGDGGLDWTSNGAVWCVVWCVRPTPIPVLQFHSTFRLHPPPRLIFWRPHGSIIQNGYIILARDTASNLL